MENVPPIHVCAGVASKTLPHFGEPDHRGVASGLSRFDYGGRVKRGPGNKIGKVLRRLQKLFVHSVLYTFSRGTMTRTAMIAVFFATGLPLAAQDFDGAMVAAALAQKNV